MEGAAHERLAVGSPWRTRCAPGVNGAPLRRNVQLPATAVSRRARDVGDRCRAGLPRRTALRRPGPDRSQPERIQTDPPPQHRGPTAMNPPPRRLVIATDLSRISKAFLATTAHLTRGIPSELILL